MPPQPAAPDRAYRGEQIRPNDILGTADINYPIWVSLIEYGSKKGRMVDRLKGNLWTVDRYPYNNRNTTTAATAYDNNRRRNDRRRTPAVNVERQAFRDKTSERPEIQSNLQERFGFTPGLRMTA